MFTHKSVPVIFEPPCIKASIIARNAQVRGEGHSIVYGMERTGMQSSHCGRRSWSDDWISGLLPQLSRGGVSSYFVQKATVGWLN